MTIHAHENQTSPDISMEAGASFAAKQYYFVKRDSAGLAQIASAAGQRCTGITQDAVASGAMARVRTTGRSYIVLGGTVAVGDLMKSDSAGKGVTAAGATTDASGASATAALVGPNVMGECVVGGDAGQIGTIDLDSRGAVPTTAA